MKRFTLTDARLGTAVSGRRLIALAAGAVAVPAAVLVGQSAAYAANTACPSAASSTATSCTYNYTGGEQTYTVPPGVTAVTVAAVGAPGGAGDLSAGGMGAVVTATVPLPAGATTLYVNVGGPGLGPYTGGGHAFNGGGASTAGADSAGGGGGGASDVRTTSITTVPDSALTPANDSRLVVAGGGGGGGAPCSTVPGNNGGNAGDPTVSGPGAGGNSDSCSVANGDDGGFGGTAGGSAGAGVCPSYSGSLGQGGDAVGCGGDYGTSWDGGGGGGYYGGGAGGETAIGGAGGGGAGSSFWVAGATDTSMTEDTTGIPQVVISWTPADAPLTITHIAAFAGQHRQAAAGVTFTDADPAGNLSQYSGTIDWGDGVTTAIPHSQFITVPRQLGGGFAAGGIHSYATRGRYTVTITINDTGGASATAHTTLTVPGFGNRVAPRTGTWSFLTRR